MQADFDKAAKDYDSIFTHTKIGKRQRDVVWDYLDSLYHHNNTPLNILELNCGTGEDAQHFAEAGHTVLATDISQEMLNLTQGKCQTFSNVKTQQLDLTILPNLNQKFDLIFSNFGGLNCLDKDQLRQFSEWSKDHLAEDGSLILVIMPRETLIEKWYRKYKGDEESLRLRQSEEPTEVNVDGQAVKTYFYNPDEVTDLFSGFEIIKVKATGYVPSYWSGNRLESVMNGLGSLFGMLGLKARFGDHFLVELRKSD